MPFFSLTSNSSFLMPLVFPIYYNFYLYSFVRFLPSIIVVFFLIIKGTKEEYSSMKGSSSRIDLSLRIRVTALSSDVLKTGLWMIILSPFSSSSLNLV